MKNIGRKLTMRPGSPSGSGAGPSTASSIGLQRLAVAAPEVAVDVLDVDDRVVDDGVEGQDQR
ncbi:MAG: hypothetical protein R3F30_00150 [Planctomycetota bacterium]